MRQGQELLAADAGLDDGEDGGFGGPGIFAERLPGPALGPAEAVGAGDLPAGGDGALVPPRPRWAEG
eukprot:5754936-Alexandrium_andersonii.AAC.1